MDLTLGGGLKVSPLGFGCMGITAFYGASMEDEDAVKLLKAAYDMGYRHFDSAEVYASNMRISFAISFASRSDLLGEQVGQFLRTVPRDSYTIATKYFPGRHGETYDLASTLEAVEASLKRLGLDYIDLYYIHRPPPTLEQAEEWMRSMRDWREIVNMGKVKYVGLSEFSPEWTRTLHAIHPVTAMQIEWSLVTRNLVEEILLDCCKDCGIQSDLGIAIVAYSPLARNLLAAAPTEVPTDWRKNQPRYNEENLKRNQELLKKIEAMAESKKCSAAQLSLAWLYFKAGTTKIANAEANFAARSEEATLLEELGAQVAGNRGNEAYENMGLEGNMKKVYRSVQLFCSYEGYLKAMATDATWGDHVTLQAAADALGVRLDMEFLRYFRCDAMG
eukprot:s48_g7.t1